MANLCTQPPASSTQWHVGVSAPAVQAWRPSTSSWLFQIRNPLAGTGHLLCDRSTLAPAPPCCSALPCQYATYCLGFSASEYGCSLRTRFTVTWWGEVGWGGG